MSQVIMSDVINLYYRIINLYLLFYMKTKTRVNLPRNSNIERMEKGIVKFYYLCTKDLSW